MPQVIYSIINASPFFFFLQLLCPNIIATLLTIVTAEYNYKNFARFDKAVS